MNKQGIIYTVVLTFVICFLFICVLSLANSAFADLIKRNKDLNERKAVLSAFGIGYKDDAQAFTLFDKKISSEIIGGIKLITFTVNGEKAYAIIFQGQGLWGMITGVLAVDKEADTIIGIDLISHNETPGLGGRIDEPWFKNQFRNKALSAEGTIKIGKPKTDSAGELPGEVDAITAATQTSRAFEKIINQYLNTLRTVLGAQ
jgi:Na+-transporting NADH:ubiquinone oxidoreductase subunit C